MNRYDIEDVTIVALVFFAATILIALIGYVGIKAMYKAEAQADCLAQGYPDSRIDWKFDAYCVSYNFRTAVKK